MIVNWQLQNQPITVLVCTEQQNIEHRVIVNIVGVVLNSAHSAGHNTGTDNYALHGKSNIVTK